MIILFKQGPQEKSESKSMKAGSIRVLKYLESRGLSQVVVPNSSIIEKEILAFVASEARVPPDIILAAARLHCSEKALISSEAWVFKGLIQLF